MLIHRTIGAIFPAAAFAAPSTAPDGIELFCQGFDQRRIVRQDPVLEVAAVLAFRTHARPSQVRTAEVCLSSVRDDAFEVDTRTQYPFDPGP